MANAFHNSNALAGTFGVMITPQKGQKLDDLVAIADAEIDRLKKEGPTEEEIEPRSRTPPRAARSSRSRPSRPSPTSSTATTSSHGDPLAYKKELREAYAVTVADVKRVANKYLSGHRIRLDVNPGPKTPRPEETPVDRSAQSGPCRASPSSR